MMMHNSMAIKNLAIALEALSRINGANYSFARVERLLGNEIQKAEDPPPQPPTTSNDDIPF